MIEAMDKLSSHWWWLDSQKKGTLNRSPWLQSALAELDEKTEAMLKIVEQDADSFAQRAEMYYKKRPQLINMVEDFYRTHRLLAEKYDQIKCESGTRLMTPWMSPLSLTKYHSPKKLMSATEISYDTYSETFDHPESELSDNMSEVEDPELDNEEEEIQTPKSEKETMVEVSSGFRVSNDEVVKLREEIERLKEENRVQQELLVQKDEEKREVIRQLSLAVDLLREENIMLRKSVAKPAPSPKKENIIELKTLKEGFRKTPSPKKESVIELKTFREGFWKRLFNGSP